MLGSGPCRCLSEECSRQRNSKCKGSASGTGPTVVEKQGHSDCQDVKEKDGRRGGQPRGDLGATVEPAVHGARWKSHLRVLGKGMT